LVSNLRLTVSCPDRKGLISALSSLSRCTTATSSRPTSTSRTGARSLCAWR
jgi:formyltetrahydrofolate hydrolase